LLTKYSW